MKTKILVIVDPQQDFLSPLGSLYVKNDKLTEKIMRYALDNDFDHILITLDNHPINHCSFIDQGGKFPKHCIKGSIGASYDSNILLIVNRKPAIVDIVTKGEYAETEEFGAFNEYDDFDDYIDDAVFGEVEVYVCGVAGDYCVKETIQNILDYSYIVTCEDVIVLKNLIVSIDDGSTLNKFIEEEGLKTSEEDGLCTDVRIL